MAVMVPNGAFIPGLERAGIDGRVLLFTIVVAMVSALLFSALACVGLLRPTAGIVSTQRRATMAPAERIAGSALVAAEIALAVVLLVGAGLTLRSFANLLAVDTGFVSSGVLTAQLTLPDGQYGTNDARRAFYTRAFADIEALPGVEAVGAAMVTPMTGNNWSAPLQRVDRPVPAGQRPPEVGWQMASRGYFSALRIPLRKGRLFEPGDATGDPVVIISEAAAARHFPGEEPLGHRIDLGDMKAEIVGVVGNIRRTSLADDPRADLYFPFEREQIPSITLFIRATGDPVAALPGVRAALARLDNRVVLYQTRTLSDIAEESAAVTRLATRLLGGFAIIALLLAAIGVYGVMSYRVRRRTRELGTRVALGASPGHITRLVLRHAGAIALGGVAIGGSAALVFARALSSVLFGVTPWDPVTLASSVVLLMGATAVASYLPARRAARIDPASALASE
jgi:predicted permease